jgi:hypothetical protein
MPNRPAKIASAIFASLLAGASLTAITRSAAGADEECLSAPKGETPQGSHWFYRIDRTTKRQCWYVRDEGEKAASIAAPKPPSSAKPAAAKPDPAIQSSVANAHAELPSQPRFDQLSRANRAAAAMPANAPLSEADKNLQPPVAATQPSAATSRWLDQSNAAAATSPAPLANPEPPAGTQVNTAPQAQPSAPPSAGQFTAADLSPTHSVQMLLAAILGALALAGVMGRLIFNFVGTRRRAKRRVRGRRDSIWKSAPAGRKPSPRYQRADAMPPQPHYPRDLDQVGDPDDRIVELLRDFSRKSRQAAKQRQPGVGSFL